MMRGIGALAILCLLGAGELFWVLKTAYIPGDMSGFDAYAVTGMVLLVLHAITFLALEDVAKRLDKIKLPGS